MNIKELNKFGIKKITKQPHNYKVEFLNGARAYPERIEDLIKNIKGKE